MMTMTSNLLPVGGVMQMRGGVDMVMRRRCKDDTAAGEVVGEC